MQQFNVGDRVRLAPKSQYQFISAITGAQLTATNELAVFGTITKQYSDNKIHVYQMAVKDIPVHIDVHAIDLELVGE